MRLIYIKISNSVYLDDYFLCQFLVLLLLEVLWSVGVTDLCQLV